MGYSPWGRKESDTTEATGTHARVLIQATTSSLALAADKEAEVPLTWPSGKEEEGGGRKRRDKARVGKVSTCL